MKTRLKKTILAVAVSVAVFTAFSCASVYAALPSHILGDADGDGEINIKDATYVQKVVSDLIEEPEDFVSYADVSGDSLVNVQDITIIQKYVANIISDFPKNSTNPTTDPVTEPTTKPTVDPYATDPDGWNQQILKP